MSALPVGLSVFSSLTGCPCQSWAGHWGTHEQLVRKAEGLMSPEAGCSQLRVLFGYLIPVTWPWEGHLAGPQVHPLWEEASQAITLGKGTPGWAGHARQETLKASSTPTYLLHSVALGTWGRPRPIRKRGQQSERLQGLLLSERDTWSLPEPHASCRPLLPSAQTCLLLLSLGPRCLPAEPGGVPQGQGRLVLVHTHTQLWGEGCTRSGVAARQDGAGSSLCL